MRPFLLLALILAVNAQFFKQFRKIDFTLSKFVKNMDMNFDLDSCFSEFEKAFDKMYFHPGERENRKRIFRETTQEVLRHNKKKNNLYSQDVNQFSDLTFEEFAKKYLVRDIEKLIKEEFLVGGRKLPRSRMLDGKQHHVDHKRDERLLQANLKREVSWEKHLTGIKDQKTCAGCYAFSAVAGFEAMRSIKRKRKQVFSEQSVIDCVKYNNGCISGTPGRVLDYIHDHGIAFSSSYPYVSKKQQCRSSIMRTKGKFVKDTIDYDFLGYGVLEVLEALQYSPVILVQTVDRAFRNYKRGILDTTTCTDELDHSTLAYGYNLNAPVPYIMVKNSWGASWGDGGFFKIKIGPLSHSNGGLCQIANHEYNLKLYFTKY